MHPSTYLNKDVLGGTDRMILLNVRTAEVIHEFSCLGGEITAREQSPAVDTITVGTREGMVHLVNLRQDKKLFSLNHNQSSIASLSFRMDGSAMRYGIAPLAVGRRDRTISVWDLTLDPKMGGFHYCSHARCCQLHIKYNSSDSREYLFCSTHFLFNIFFQKRCGT